ncbi:MAG: urease accessory protein UreD [Aestuariivirga sp.]
MQATLEQFHRQRSFGRVKLEFGPMGLIRHREEGSAKARMLPGGKQAVLLNIGGGLAGGDDFGFDVKVNAATTLTVASQTAERVYRSLGATAHVNTKLAVAEDATLYWLPQETIFYDGAKLHRTITAELARSAKLVMLEPAIFGRSISDEKITSIDFHDRWRIHVAGKLLFADDLQVGPALPERPAAMGEATAMATLFCVGADFETLAPKLNSIFGDHGASSFWNGKLVARLLAKDGYTLRKLLIKALGSFVEADNLPLNWTV